MTNKCQYTCFLVIRNVGYLITVGNYWKSPSDVIITRPSHECFTFCFDKIYAWIPVFSRNCTDIIKVVTHPKKSTYTRRYFVLFHLVFRFQMRRQCSQILLRMVMYTWNSLLWSSIHKISTSSWDLSTLSSLLTCSTSDWLNKGESHINYEQSLYIYAFASLNKKCLLTITQHATKTKNSSTVSVLLLWWCLQ